MTRLAMRVSPPSSKAFCSNEPMTEVAPQLERLLCNIYFQFVAQMTWKVVLSEGWAALLFTKMLLKLIKRLETVK